jgi:predicted secreted protein
MRKGIIAALTAASLIGAPSFAALAASSFEGVWKVKDTAGHPFEITLSSGGAAKATRGEGMTGTWKEQDDSAVITWSTGWTTKITKQGDQYVKAAYRRGQSLTATPANTSDAEMAQ